MTDDIIYAGTVSQGPVYSVY